NTSSGGSTGAGTIYQITSAGDLTTVYSFSSTDGANPNALMQGSSGNFYGSTVNGGSCNLGTVYEITSAGSETILHSFIGSDGANPYGLVQGSNGNFYGATGGGGSSGNGTVFEITSAGALTSLYSFSGPDGSDPGGGLIQGRDGSFYGTTQYGGGNWNGTAESGNGTVFRITPGGTLTTLYSFSGLDGSSPIGSLVQDNDGNFYGNTQYGGTTYVSESNPGSGAVFRITPGGTLTTLHSFTGSDGSWPNGSLVQAANGDLYGTTYDGGADGSGSVFYITPAGALTTLYSFTDADDGAEPWWIVQGSDGNFYGTAQYGGASEVGTAFKLTTAGTLTTLYSFTGTDGEQPLALVQGTDTNFYGTALLGGSSNAGTVFKITVSSMPPLTPSDVTAIAGSEQVTLTWTASTGATTYRVYRGTASEGESATAIATGVTTASYVNTGLTNGVTYYYKVAALDSNGTSVQSREVSGTPVSVPSAPTGLTAAAGNAQVALSWTASTSATSYDVYRATSTGSEGSTAVGSSTTTAYTNTGLTNGVTYFYKVAAVNGAGTSAQSTEASATPALPAPAAPTGLTATAGNAQVALSWTASTGATTYNIYRGTASGAEGSTATATGITTTSYTNTGLTNGVTYFYKVAAVNGGGTSAQSSEASATPEPPIPAAPTGLTAAAGNAQVALSWTASAGATAYNIYRGTASGAEGSSATATGITTTSYTDTGLTNGVTYFYKVAAVNGGGTSAQSSETSTMPALQAPAAPTGLSATAGNSQVALSWTASTGATTYNIYRGSTTSVNTSTAVGTTPSTSYTDTGLTNGVRCFYRIAAVNGAGTSPATGVVGATPEPPIPAAPTGLTATAGNSQVALTWTASTGATSYCIYRGTATGAEAATAIVAGITGLTYTNLSLTNGVTYFYKVAAINGGGTSTQSSEASATPEPPIPAAPTALTATAGSAQVALSWTASTGATTYNIYRDTASGGEGSSATATDITATSYTDTGLTNGVTYFYKVAAVNGGGTSALSSEASGTPEPPSIIESRASATSNPVTGTTGLSVPGAYGEPVGSAVVTNSFPVTIPSGIVSTVATSLTIAMRETPAPVALAPGPTLTFVAPATQQFTAITNDELVTSLVTVTVNEA
ncbi:MAG: choice-of-anchor tandem repeat GloVer-containing protein, partial [Capsulimonadaceae bacterium]